jgi:hypothetical protein
MYSFKKDTKNDIAILRLNNHIITLYTFFFVMTLSNSYSNSVNDILGEERFVQTKSTRKNQTIKLDRRKSAFKRIGHDRDYINAVMQFAKKYGYRPSDVLGLHASECSFVHNTIHGGTVGLIQFTKSSAEMVGTTQQALSQMTRAEQMVYVDRFYEIFLKGDVTTKSAGQLYIVTFLPAFSNVDNKHFIISQSGYHARLYSRGENINYSKKTVKRWYQQNRGLDKYPRDGKITLSELDDVIQKKKAEFGISD